MAEGFMPAYTPLTPSPDAEEMLLLERIWEMFPEAMQSREEFVDRMGALYDNGRRKDADGERDAGTCWCETSKSRGKRKEPEASEAKSSEG